MEHMGPDAVDLPAVPLLDREGVQQIEVLVVPVHEQCGEGPILQPVQLFRVLLVTGPYPAEVAADDDIVIPARGGPGRHHHVSQRSRQTKGDVLFGTGLLMASMYGAWI